MASARSILKSQALAVSAPAQVIQLANQLIAEDAKHGMFVTAFYGLYHIPSRTLRFINAGHTLPYLFQPSTNSCSSLFNTNFPLGVFDPFTFQESAIRLEPGDRLILYTDGVNEAFNPSRQQYGLERLVNLILQHGTRPASELQQRILESVYDFAEGQGQSDDITVLVLQVT
jgi:sigma-B regulation protein RsbU (phosphoserine phosphatase)